MKKYVLLLILFISVLSASASKYKTVFDDDYYITSNITPNTAALPVYNITATCPQSICMEGDRILFNVTMFNYGKYYFEIYSIWLVNTATHQIITFYNKTMLYADVNHKFTLTLNATLPVTHQAINLTYAPCIKIALPRDDNYYWPKYGLERGICYNSTFSTLIAECTNDQMCNMNEACENFDCLPLNCSSCQYISNHSCLNYECCDPSQCVYNATCANHQCKEFNCKFYEHIENHECTVLYCEQDEQYINNTCIKFNCSSDEYYNNHRCKKLNCSNDEAIENHSCNKLNCSSTEFAGNHSCQKLDCKKTEKIQNHSCVALNCKVYQYVQDHACTTDTLFIKSFLREFIIWVFIIVFLYLIEHLFMKRHGFKKGIV
jgi:hypothetical protein